MGGLVAAPVHGARPPALRLLTIIERAGQPLYRAFSRDLSAALTHRGIANVRILDWEPGQLPNRQMAHRLDRSAFIVTVGPRSLAWRLAQNLVTPTLATYVTREDFHRLTGSPHRFVTAIYLNQPFERFLALARILIPRLHAISAVLSLDQKWRRPLIERVAHAHGYAAHIVVTPVDPRAIFSAFRFALPGTDALIELPDTTVYNPFTLPEIFLRAFRYGVPMIGYAPESVHDGALAGLYSTPSQFSRQALPIVLSAVAGGRVQLPAPAYPRLFKVLLNRTVAGTLGIPLPDLPRVLMEMHRRHPPRPAEFGT